MLTRIRSPTISVGTMELDGILNGSYRNERRKNTSAMTGKKLPEYSIQTGCFISADSMPARVW